MFLNDYILPNIGRVCSDIYFMYSTLTVRTVYDSLIEKILSEICIQ